MTPDQQRDWQARLEHLYADLMARPKEFCSAVDPEGRMHWTTQIEQRLAAGWPYEYAVRVAENEILAVAPETAARPLRWSDGELRAVAEGRHHVGIPPHQPGPVSSAIAGRLRVEENRRWFENDRGRFDYREVGAFSLLSRLLAGEAAYVRDFLMSVRVSGFTMVRNICTLDGAYWVRTPHGRSLRSAPDMPDYEGRVRQLVDLCGEVGLYLRLCLIGAVEPFGGVWHPDRRGVWEEDVRCRGEAFCLRMAELTANVPWVLLEIANEPRQIGLRGADDALVDLGRRLKQIAPETLLNLGAADGVDEADTTFARSPADFVDGHIGRMRGVGGFEWIKRSGENPVIDQEDMPFTSGEPLNFGEPRADGRTGDVEPDPVLAFCYGAVSRSRRYNATFHSDFCLWTTMPKPQTAACILSFHDGLDAFPMLTDARWRGHWDAAQGSYWRKDIYPGDDDPPVVEDHVGAGRGPWRIFGCGPYSVSIAEPMDWDWQAGLTAPAERVAVNRAGKFAGAVYRRR